MSEKKVIANSTNQNVRSIMEELHISLTPNKEHKTVIPNVHVVGCSLLTGQFCPKCSCGAQRTCPV